MSYQIDVLDPSRDLEALRGDWDALVRADCETVRGHDATSSLAWFEALSAAFPAARETRVVVVRDGAAVVAMLPVAREPGSSGCARLFVPTVLYGGRNGLMLRQAQPELTLALLGGLSRAFGPWRNLRLTLVEGSDAERLLVQACERSGYRLVDDDERMASPYFPLHDDAEAFSAGMSKGLKQTLRTATNKFRTLGTLACEELVDESQAEAAIEAVLEIDRGSWKHEAGSAITRKPDQERFYRALFPTALRSRLLYGQIARLDGKPIAFNFGLVQGSVFCCLKHSQTLEFQNLSPGQLLNAAMIDRLRAKGVRTYDFMGKPEAHKMRWSDRTGLYTVRHAWVFGTGVCGRLGYTIYRIKQLAKQARARIRPAAPPSAPGDGEPPARTDA